MEGTHTAEEADRRAKLQAGGAVLIRAGPEPNLSDTTDGGQQVRSGA